MGVKTRIRRDDHRGVGLVVPASRRTHMPLVCRRRGICWSPADGVVAVMPRLECVGTHGLTRGQPQGDDRFTVLVLFSMDVDMEAVANSRNPIWVAFGIRVELLPAMVG